MSAEAVPIPASNTNLGTSSLSSEPSSLPVWDRLTTWASENKAVVYTAAGVAVVISGAGVAYYLSDSRKNAVAAEKKRLSKKERRKAKHDKDEKRSQPEAKTVSGQPTDSMTLACLLGFYAHKFAAQSKAPTVESDPLEGLPQIDESTVETISEQV